MPGPVNPSKPMLLSKGEISHLISREMSGWVKNLGEQFGRQRGAKKGVGSRFCHRVV